MIQDGDGASRGTRRERATRGGRAGGRRAGRLLPARRSSPTRRAGSGGRWVRATGQRMDAVLGRRGSPPSRGSACRLIRDLRRGEAHRLRRRGRAGPREGARRRHAVETFGFMNPPTRRAKRPRRARRRADRVGDCAGSASAAGRSWWSRRPGRDPHRWRAAPRPALVARGYVQALPRRERPRGPRHRAGDVRHLARRST